jgi:LPXTG-motif cell wall-anchored protein
MDTLPEAPNNNNVVTIIGIILILLVLAGAYYVKVYKKKVTIAKPEVIESKESKESEKPKET